MILGSRYEGPTILSVDGDPKDQLQPLARQRRRMNAMLAELTDEEWTTPSRCDGWVVRDVVDQFVATNEALLGAVAELDDAGWSVASESPAGHVPIRLLAQHALWDCWVHERDIAIPLDIEAAFEPDEVKSCLQFAAAVSPVLGLGLGHSSVGAFGVKATNPDVQFVVDVGASVAVRDQAPASSVPCLHGDAVALIEALSLRAPLPPSTPIEWTQLLDGLATAFDAV